MGECEECKAKREESLQRRAASGGVSLAGNAVPSIVHDVLSSPGQPLDVGTRAFMEPRFGHDFSQVRIHTDARAVESAQAVNALAYTVGRNVVFGAGQYAPQTSEGRRLLAHELTHTLQQDNRVQRAVNEPLMTEPDGAAERQAENTATAILRADDFTVTSQETGKIARQPVPAPVVPVATPSTAPTTSYVQSVIDALDRPDPIAGVGDFQDAFRILNGLSMTDMLATLTELNRRGYLDLLLSHSDAAASFNRPRLMAAIHVVKLSGLAPTDIKNEEIIETGNNMSQLPSDQATTLIEYLIDKKVSGAMSSLSREGLLATIAPALYSISLPASVLASITAPIGPGPFTPPGNQPIPFYIGNTAHISIAATYVAEHPGQLVFTNFTPISTILGRLGANSSGLSASDLDMKPDIINIDPAKRHLYEIKPQGAESLATTEANLYIAVFARAGVPIVPGPTTEPGTSGVIPAPGGYYLFESPLPGVIAYQYRRGTFVPVPIPQTNSADEKERSSLRIQLPRLTAPALSAQQQAVLTMEVGTMALIIVMILLSPVGA
jgi:hypothetical protein